MVDLTGLLYLRHYLHCPHNRQLAVAAAAMARAPSLAQALAIPISVLARAAARASVALRVLDCWAGNERKSHMGRHLTVLPTA